MSALPKHPVDPFRQASLGAEYQGDLPFDNMSRLLEAAMNQSDGSVRYRLRFMQPHSRDHQLAGDVLAIVSLPCQRCFRPSVHEIRSSFRFKLVETEAEMALVEDDDVLEPLLVENAQINLVQLIEDEVLLNLPTYAVHEDEQACQGSDWAKWMDAEKARRDEFLDEELPQKKNPFAVLAGLKDTSSESEDGN